MINPSTSLGRHAMRNTRKKLLPVAFIRAMKATGGIIALCGDNETEKRMRYKIQTSCGRSIAMNNNKKPLFYAERTFV